MYSRSGLTGRGFHSIPARLHHVDLRGVSHLSVTTLPSPYHAQLIAGRLTAGCAACSLPSWSALFRGSQFTGVCALSSTRKVFLVVRTASSPTRNYTAACPLPGQSEAQRVSTPQIAAVAVSANTHPSDSGRNRRAACKPVQVNGRHDLRMHQPKVQVLGFAPAACFLFANLSSSAVQDQGLHTGKSEPRSPNGRRIFEAGLAPVRKVRTVFTHQHSSNGIARIDFSCPRASSAVRSGMRELWSGPPSIGDHGIACPAEPTPTPQARPLLIGHTMHRPYFSSYIFFWRFPTNLQLGEQRATRTHSLGSTTATGRDEGGGEKAL